MGHKQEGFSLIELLIVVAIILIIAAVAIPSLIQSKMSANEASAVQTVRDINTAQSVYFIQYGVGYSQTLAELGGTSGTPSSSSALLIPDPVAQTGTKSGFQFIYAVTGNNGPNGAPSNYTVNGNPIGAGSTGRIWYFTDETMVIRENPTQPASSTDPSI
jgi:prepilin-type N-terminal cleavage/methylation domain-containing protein